MHLIKGYTEAWFLIDADDGMLFNLGKNVLVCSLPNFHQDHALEKRNSKHFITT